MTKEFEKVVAQGDMLMVKVDGVPDEVKRQHPINGELIITHSETGHSHVIKESEGVELYQHANDNLKAYLVVENEPVDLVHKRSYHTHETVRINKGVYAIFRQRQEDIYGEIRQVVD